MYSSPSYSSIPFCDHTLPHQSHHRAFSHSHSPSPLPTLPHRACFLSRDSDKSPKLGGRQSSPRESPIASTRARISSTPRQGARSSSTCLIAPPKAPPSSPILADRIRIAEKQWHEAGHQGGVMSDGTIQLILTDTLSSPQLIAERREEPQTPTIDDNYQDSVDSFIGQTSPSQTSPCPLSSRSIRREAVAKSSQRQHRKIQRLPQMSLLENPLPIKRDRSDHARSLDTKICLGGDVGRVKALEPSPQITYSPRHPVAIKPRRPSVPLRLFPPSPTSSTTSDRSGHPDAISPVASTFHPSLYMQQQVSVFEDDDEKMGLIDYFKWPIQGDHKTKKMKRGKHRRGCGWQRLLCWRC